LKLFPQGKGCLLTGDDIHEERVDADTEKREKEVAKALQKEDQALQKARNEAMVKLWKAQNNGHKEAVAKWTVTCAKLKGQGTSTRVKDVPKKPAHPKKANIEKEVDRYDKSRV